MAGKTNHELVVGDWVRVLAPPHQGREGKVVAFERGDESALVRVRCDDRDRWAVILVAYLVPIAQTEPTS